MLAPSDQTNESEVNDLSDVFSVNATGASGLVTKVIGLLIEDDSESPYTLYAIILT